jgi:hypothetical protein
MAAPPTILLFFADRGRFEAMRLRLQQAGVMTTATPPHLVEVTAAPQALSGYGVGPDEIVPFEASEPFLRDLPLPTQLAVRGYWARCTQPPTRDALSGLPWDTPGFEAPRHLGPKRSS